MKRPVHRGERFGRLPLPSNELGFLTRICVPMPADSIPSGNRNLHIGKYQVINRIASGGMGAVYKALDLKRGREVALKVLTPEQVAAKPILLERFRLEARYGRRLNHENVVSVYGQGEQNGLYYLALEFVDGVDLHEYACRLGKLSVDES